MTYDYREHTAAEADLSGLVRKYMAMLGLDIAPLIKVRNSLGAKALGTTKWSVGQPTSTISIQKVVLGDPKTLERIVAHEMAHHANFVDHIKALQAIAKERGAEAGPYVRGYVQSLRREDGHGEGWLRYVKVINSQMGADFVTKISDQSDVQDTQTKPYFVLIAWLPNEKYGYQIGVNLSPKMKQWCDRWIQEYKAKLLKTTDAKWQHGPRIGGVNWATSPDKQAEMQRLYGAA